MENTFYFENFWKLFLWRPVEPKFRLFPKIPQNRSKSAPPVANNDLALIFRNKLSILTSTYEGLSFGPAQKKTQMEFTIFLVILRFSQISPLKDSEKSFIFVVFGLDDHRVSVCTRCRLICLTRDSITMKNVFQCFYERLTKPNFEFHLQQTPWSNS